MYVKDVTYEAFRPSLQGVMGPKSVNILAGNIEGKYLDTIMLRRKCIVLFKLVDLSRSADVLAVSFKSIKFLEDGMLGSRRPLKSYSKDR